MGPVPDVLTLCMNEHNCAQAGDDPYVRQTIAKLAEGEKSKGFLETLKSAPEHKKVRGNMAVIEAVMPFLDSKSVDVHREAEKCVPEHT